MTVACQNPISAAAYGLYRIGSSTFAGKTSDNQFLFDEVDVAFESDLVRLALYDLAKNQRSIENE